MKKEELRKVKVKRSEHNPHGEFEINGYFHQFGNFPMDTEKNGMLNETKGLVELENGEIKICAPQTIKFVDSF